MGIAVLVDPKLLVEVRQDFENYLVLVKVEPGKPFVYYMGATRRWISIRAAERCPLTSLSFG
jgi:hypothetical protein